VSGERSAAIESSGVADVVADLWQRVRAELRRSDPGGTVDAALAPWLEQVEPVALREGTLELLTRSPRSLAHLRQRLLPPLERAVRRALGAPVRVRIDLDQSLGGALLALGVPMAPRPPAPPLFVARPETRLAQTALLRLAREPRPEFDQVVLEGPRGVGKTLLLSSFLAQRRRRFPRERWRLERAETFFRDFAAACREGARATFRGERVACDGFLLDDAQELAGKLACQETLAEMLEYFRARGRTVVVATEPLEGGPREFVPALRSLLRLGLRVPIAQLSAASRAEILDAHARRLMPAAAAPAHAPAAPFLLELAAATELPLGRCIRGLEDVAAIARRLGRAPRREEIELELPDLLPRAGAAEPFDRVLDRCAQYVGVSRDALVAGARTRGAALGRHLAVYLAVAVFRLQRATLKRWLGTLSPSVLPYAKAKIESLRATDRRLDGFIREVSDEIGRGQRFLFG
jgi:chromosomal replication initiation ATPase DnaA